MKLDNVIMTSLAAIVLLASSVLAYDPPRGMKWGMTYEECKTALGQPKGEDEALKIGKIQQVKANKNQPAGYGYAQIKSVKLFGKKAKTAVAMFDSTGGLCQISYTFSWDNDDKKGQDIFSRGGTGREKCYQLHGKLVDGLSGKYGEPVKEPKGDIYGTSIAHGVTLETIWEDTTSHTMIGVVLTRNKTNLVIGMLDEYIVQLVYLGPTAMAFYQDAVQEDENL